MKTEAQKLQNQYQLNRQLIQAWTGITDLQYTEMVFETGCKYAEKELGNDPYHIFCVLSSKQFWAWWVSQWNRRNEEFIHQIEASINGKSLIYSCLIKTGPTIVEGLMILKTEAQVCQVFRQIHSIQTLNIYPNRAILEETYKEMSYQFIKDQTSKHQ